MSMRANGSGYVGIGVRVGVRWLTGVGMGVQEEVGMCSRNERSSRNRSWYRNTFGYRKNRNKSGSAHRNRNRNSQNKEGSENKRGNGNAFGNVRGRNRCGIGEGKRWIWQCA